MVSDLKKKKFEPPELLFIYTQNTIYLLSNSLKGYNWFLPLQIIIIGFSLSKLLVIGFGLPKLIIIGCASQVTIISGFGLPKLSRVSVSPNYPPNQQINLSKKEENSNEAWPHRYHCSYMFYV